MQGSLVALLLLITYKVIEWLHCCLHIISLVLQMRRVWTLSAPAWLDTCNLNLSMEALRKGFLANLLLFFEVSLQCLHIYSVNHWWSLFLLLFTEELRVGLFLKAWNWLDLSAVVHRVFLLCLHIYLGSLFLLWWHNLHRKCFCVQTRYLLNWVTLLHAGL